MGSEGQNNLNGGSSREAESDRQIRAGRNNSEVFNQSGVLPERRGRQSVARSEISARSGSSNQIMSSAAKVVKKMAPGDVSFRDVEAQFDIERLNV